MAQKTTLSEDANIYTKRETQSEREKLSVMTKGEKWSYFKDYYAKKVIIGGAFLCFVLYVLYTLIAPKPENILYAAIINDNLEETKEETIIKEFGESINYDSNRQNIIFEDTFFLNPENMDLTTQSKITTYAYAETLDVIIADEEIFQWYVDSNFFVDLTQVLPSDTYSDVTNSLYMAQSGIDKENSQSAKAYGIYLDTSKIYTESSANYQEYYGTPSKRMIIGIVQNTKNKETCTNFIKYLFKH